MLIARFHAAMFSGMVCLAVVACPTPSPAALLMKADGSCVDVSISPEASILVVNPHGEAETQIALGDLIWVAGGDVKKLRVRGRKALLIGSIQGGIAVDVGGSKTTLADDSYVFLLNREVKTSDVHRLLVFEHDNGSMETSWSISDGDGKGATTVSVLPEYWNEGPKLITATYEKNQNSNSNMVIKVTIDAGRGQQITRTADLQLCINYNYGFNPRKAGDGVSTSGPSKTGGMVVSPFENRRTHYVNEYEMIGSYYYAATTAPVNNTAHCAPLNNDHLTMQNTQLTSDSAGYSVEVEYSHPFRNMLLGTMSGRGVYYLYLVSPEKKLLMDTYAGGRLEVFRTGSNVLQLPIVVE